VAAAVAVLAAALAACGPTGLYRTADPVPRGRWQLGAAGGLGTLRDNEQQTSLPTGHIEVETRRGITDSFDLGAKIHTIGVEVNATWRLVHRRWSLALAPSLGGAWTQSVPFAGEAIHGAAGTAVIASRPLSPRWTVAFGPLGGWGLYWPETGGSAQGIWLGAFTLLAFRASDRVYVTPELDAFRVVSGEVPVRGGGLRLGLGVRCLIR
jgi:hypothetical protein